MVGNKFSVCHYSRLPSGSLCCKAKLRLHNYTLFICSSCLAQSSGRSQQGGVAGFWLKGCRQEQVENHYYLLGPYGLFEAPGYTWERSAGKQTCSTGHGSKDDFTLLQKELLSCFVYVIRGVQADKLIHKIKSLSLKVTRLNVLVAWYVSVWNSQVGFLHLRGR